MGRFLKPTGAAGLALAYLLCGAGSALAQAAPDAGMGNLPVLSDRAAGGSVRCPDGSTRPFSGEAPNDLTIAMLCDVPADVAALGPYGRGYRRSRFVFDLSEGTPKIIYRQSLGHLGWALGRETRQTWLATATP